MQQCDDSVLVDRSKHEELRYEPGDPFRAEVDDTDDEGTDKTSLVIVGDLRARSEVPQVAEVGGDPQRGRPRFPNGTTATTLPTRRLSEANFSKSTRGRRGAVAVTAPDDGSAERAQRLESRCRVAEDREGRVERESSAGLG
jgi:hypothetical protein